MYKRISAPERRSHSRKGTEQMKTSITIWSFHREIGSGAMDVPGFLKEAKKLGFKAVELLSVWTESPEQIKQVRESAADLGLAICAYGIHNDFACAGSELDAQVDFVRKGIETAARLGCPILRVFGGDAKEGLTFDKARGTIVEGFYRCAPDAKAAGVTMALENHGWLSCTSNSVLRIIKGVGSPALKSTLDTGNFLIGDEDPIVAARNLAKEVAHVHVKDVRWKTPPDEKAQVFVSVKGRKVQPETIGEGEIDLPKILRILKKADYQGYLSLEYEGNDPEPKGIPISAKNLLRMAAEVG